jgi:FkbM family methyltransferase
MPAGLREHFFTELLSRCYAAETGVGSGWDPSREWENPPSRRVRDAVAAVAARTGFARRRFDLEPAANALDRVTSALPRLERTYELLADEPSRELLVRLLAFRVLGPHHVALPVSHRRLRELEERVERLPGAALESPFGDSLPLLSARGRRGKVRLHAHPSAVVEFFELEQYAYREGTTVAPEPGELAIDGGAGWGDTALWLADAVGPEGRVVSVELEGTNLAMARRNLDLNPDIASRVRLVDGALWSEAGRELDFTAAGPSSALGGGGASTATTVTIDELRERESLERIDFIKLDVEGAELEALRGAADTLRLDRPKLAIAAYHADDDLIDLPAHLADLDLGYELYLGHYTPGWHETILFGRAR